MCLLDGNEMGCDEDRLRARGGEAVGLDEWMLMGEFEAAGMPLEATLGGEDTVLSELGRNSGGSV
jgi:hypothetical protein